MALVPAAFGIFLVSFADEILTARSFAGKPREHVRASQELVSHGRRERRGRLHAGLLGRRERLADRGERLDGRPDADRRACRRRDVALVLLFLTEPVQYLPRRCWAR